LDASEEFPYWWGAKRECGGARTDQGDWRPMPALTPVVHVPKLEGSVSAETARLLTTLHGDLRAARAAIEKTLLAEEAYRALLQLNAREQSGSPLAAMASADLRRHLVSALRYSGDYQALAQIDAALAGLAGEPIGRVVLANVAAAETTAVAAVAPSELSPAPAPAPEPTPVVPPLPVLTPAAAVARAFSSAFRRATAPAPVVPVQPITIDPAVAPALQAVAAPVPAATTVRDAINTAEAAVFASVARLRGDASEERSVPVPQAEVVATPPSTQRAELPPAPVRAAAPTHPRPVTNYAWPAPAILPAALATAKPPAPFPVIPIHALAPAPLPAPIAVVPPVAVEDRLDRIRGVDAGMAVRLRQLGVTRYAQIAAWGPLDVEIVRRNIGPDALVQRHNWIEQAAMLAAGRITRYARAVDAGIENTARRLPAEGPPRRFGVPAFFRLGLPGGPSLMRIAPVAPRPAPLPQPELASPLRSSAPQPVAASVASQNAGPVSRPMMSPALTQRPELPSHARASAALQPPLAAGTHSGSNGHSGVNGLYRAPDAGASRPPAAVPRGTFRRADIEPVPGDLPDDWADVSIVSRPSPSRPEPAMPQRTQVISPSLAQSQPLSAVSVRRPAASLRSTLDDAVPEEEASVEIRRLDAPPPPPEPAHETNGFGRLLRALKPGDRLQ
jgi:predicted flap endonuclease-1-like 5' DNA nuclease